MQVNPKTHPEYYIDAKESENVLSHISEPIEKEEEEKESDDVYQDNKMWDEALRIKNHDVRKKEYTDAYNEKTKYRRKKQMNAWYQSKKDDPEFKKKRNQYHKEWRRKNKDKINARRRANYKKEN